MTFNPDVQHRERVMYTPFSTYPLTWHVEGHGEMLRWLLANPLNTKHLCNLCTVLDQRRRRWADFVQMLYKCFVFAGL